MQIIIDTFISSAEGGAFYCTTQTIITDTSLAKWLTQSGIVLNLPHG